MSYHPYFITKKHVLLFLLFVIASTILAPPSSCSIPLTHLYIAFWGSPPFPSLAKVQVSPLNLVSNISTLTGVGLRAISEYGNYLYVSGRLSDTNSTGVVNKVDLSTFTKISNITFASDEQNAFDSVIKQGMLYVCLYTPAKGKIAKVNLTTFTQVATLTLSDVSAIRSMETVGNYMYGSSIDDPIKIAKIDLTTFTEIDTLTLNSGEGYTQDTTVYGNQLYVISGSAPSKIVQINLTSFTRVASLEIGETYARKLATDGTYLYLGAGYTQRIIKVDLSSFTKVATLSLTDSGDDIDGMGISQGYLYLACDNSTDVVKPLIKVALLDFTQVESLGIDAKDVDNIPVSIFVPPSLHYLNVISEPVTTSFSINEINRDTPYQTAIPGKHNFTAVQTVLSNGKLYHFNRWTIEGIDYYNPSVQYQFTATQNVSISLHYTLRPAPPPSKREPAKVEYPPSPHPMLIPLAVLGVGGLLLIIVVLRKKLEST